MFDLLKKSFSIVLIFLTVVISTGYFFIYSGYLHQHKLLVRSFIASHKSSADFSYITINPSELYEDTKDVLWKDDNQEILFKDVLYDIVNIKSTNGKVILTVLSDSQEQRMTKAFEEFFGDEQQSSNDNAVKLLKQFLGLKYISGKASLIVNYFAIHNEYLPCHIFKPRSVFLPIETIPPICFSHNFS